MAMISLDPTDTSSIEGDIAHTRDFTHMRVKCAPHACERYKPQLRYKCALYKYISRCISLNPLFFSQKNTFFLESKNKFIQSTALANYTFFSSFGQFVYTTPKKFLIFRGKSLIKPFSNVFVRIKVPLSKHVAHRQVKQVIVRRCQVSKRDEVALPS